MSAFLILDPRPVYFTSTGAVAAGGSLKFFQAGTTTPQNVYGNQALTVNNGAVLTLGSDGRTSVDVWGDGTLAYRVQLFDANGALQFDVDNVGLPGGSGNQIPTLQTGKFLSNDGAVLEWTDVQAVPDPTGQSGKFLTSDGTNTSWASINGGEVVQTLTAAPTTTVDYSKGPVVVINQAVDMALVFSNPVGSGNASTLTLIIKKDNSATPRAVTWPGSVTWLHGAPTMPSTANAVTGCTFISPDAGANWYGTHTA